MRRYFSWHKWSNRKSISITATTYLRPYLCSTTKVKWKYLNWDKILRKYTYKYLAKNLSLYSYACFWNLKKKTFLNWHLLLYGGGYNIVLRFYLITSLHKFNIIRHFCLRSLQHSAPRKVGKLVLAIYKNIYSFILSSGHRSWAMYLRRNIYHEAISIGIIPKFSSPFLAFFSLCP